MKCEKLFHFYYSASNPDVKLRTKTVRVQIKHVIGYEQYCVAIGLGILFITLVVALVFLIFNFRKFQVQHDVACRTAISTDAVDSNSKNKGQSHIFKDSSVVLQNRNIQIRNSTGKVNKILILFHYLKPFTVKI